MLQPIRQVGTANAKWPANIKDHQTLQHPRELEDLEARHVRQFKQWFWICLDALPWSMHCDASGSLQTYALTAKPSGRGWKICGYLTIVTLIRKQLVLSRSDTFRTGSFSSWCPMLGECQLEGIIRDTLACFANWLNVPALYCAGCWQNILASHPTEESSGLTWSDDSARWLRFSAKCCCCLLSKQKSHYKHVARF